MPHTEGDWRVGTMDKLCVPVLSKNDCVALCYGQNRVADAKLIAMSPQLAETLRDLCDLQNGPPLEKYAKEWRSVMEKATHLLESLGV